MKKFNYKWLLSFMPVLLFAIDQYTKWLARRELKTGKTVSAIPHVLSFQYVENRGAAWGVFQGRYIALAIFSIVVIAAICILVAKIPATKRFFLLSFCLMMIVGGAIGNLYDRVFHGYVTDFLHLDFIQFPVFNVADMFVTMPVAVLFVLIGFVYKEEELAFLPFFSSGKDKKTEKKQ